MGEIEPQRCDNIVLRRSSSTMKRVGERERGGDRGIERDRD